MTENFNFLSVETVPSLNASVAVVTTDIAFREDKDITPVPIGDSLSYMPWGSNNRIPYDIMNRFEEDETLGVCSAFQSEVCYASGLRYIPPEDARFKKEIEDFFLDNDMSSYFLGICRDIKMFEFAVSAIILSEDGSRITSIFRKEASFCRFSPIQDGTIPYVLYADWRHPVTSEDQVEKIPLLDNRQLRSELRRRADNGERKFAVVTRIPGVDSMYYPIPVYGSIFRGKWYSIKRLIGIAKEAKLRNSAPIKYLIEISQKYWEQLFTAEHIVEHEKKQLRANQVKQEMIDFLTGAKNSGKALFANFYCSPDGKEIRDIKITKIEDDKEGGDWASDHAEAINMICFAMRVHSNLVGSVPGKSQSNNSGSDKRELYIIAQALQSPYRDCLLHLHRIIIDYNGWVGTRPECPLLQLTTLDKHEDARKVSTNNPQPDTRSRLTQ